MCYVVFDAALWKTFFLVAAQLSFGLPAIVSCIGCFMAANFFHCGRLHIALGGGDDEIFRANRFIVLCVYLDKDVAAKALSCLPWHLTTDGTLAGAPSTLIVSSHLLGPLEERPMQQNNSLWCAI